jgi:hypothetical protein
MFKLSDIQIGVYQTIVNQEPIVLTFYIGVKLSVTLSEENV